MSRERQRSPRSGAGQNRCPHGTCPPPPSGARAPPKIAVSSAREGAFGKLSVADNGIGIDPRFQDRIFTIFQRLHERGRYPGSGIGLSIVKKIVERHKGHVRVESDIGRGARFCFTIPEARDGREELKS